MLSSLASAAGLSKAKKKFHFDVTFLLEGLLNCTYVTGVIFAKIKLRDGGSYSEISNSCDVQSHSVKWNQTFTFHTKMYASPVTGELEPCYCKVSVRKETKGGKSYKKLGYIKINLAEYAGAGATQHKYLLDSYNENKHKPDNSILQVTITLRQTSGDSLFKVPQGAEQRWELSEGPADEGIQPDIHNVQPRESFVSTVSSLSNAAGGGDGGASGGSLQDISHAASKEDLVTAQRKTSSAMNLRQSSVTDLSPETKTEGDTTAGAGPSGDHTPSNPSPLPPLHRGPKSELHGDRRELSQSELMAHHRRLSSWSQTGNGSSPHSTHRRQHSLLSGQSSKSTSAYSTLSEKSAGSFDGGDGDSMGGSLRGRLPTSTRMEESRVDPDAVIEKMFSGLTFSKSSEATVGEGGLKIYVDKNLGTVTLAGPNLDRKNSNLQAIDVNEHKSSSPKRRRKRASSHRGDRPSLSRETSPTDTAHPKTTDSEPDSMNTVTPSTTR